MMKILALTFLIISTQCFADIEKIYSPSKEESINYTCADDNCSAWIESKTTKISLFNDLPTSTINAQWHTPELARISFSCGSSCNVSFFYQKEYGASKPIRDMMALDKKRVCILKPTLDGKGIAVEKIFYKNGEKYYWQANYNDPKFGFYTQSAVIFSTIKGKFLINGQLKLSYLNSKGVNTELLINQKCPD
ncbi:hypothetical protein [Vogesella sp. LIG4]|uniref:hypothetical protein n=1 Tax=Vogesella sp. LIG4 TaxID=1192162 RepID=UPI0012FE32DE|nr:hypothetical protein [Vogesella sp. LIG4]